MSYIFTKRQCIKNPNDFFFFDQEGLIDGKSEVKVISGFFECMH